MTKLNRAGVGLLVLFFLLFFAFFRAFPVQSSKRLILYAGTIVQLPLNEAIAYFEAHHPLKIEVAYSGSGTMLSQIALSQKGDIFLSGSTDYMEKALSMGVALPETVVELAYLKPAIIVQKGNPLKIHSLEDLTRDGLKVAIAEPSSVCIGTIGLRLLQERGLEEGVGKNIKTHAPSCMALLPLISLNKVDALIGWTVFANLNPDLIEVIAIPSEWLSGKHGHRGRHNQIFSGDGPGSAVP